MRSLIVSLVTVLSACGFGTVGNGTLKSDARTVDAFHSVSIGSGFQGHVTVAEQGVTVRTDENILPLVQTFVQGDSLVVRIKPGTLLEKATTLEVAVSNTAIEGLEVSGGAKVSATATPISHFPANASGGSTLQVDGLSSDSLDLDASGGSRITLLGTATSAQAVSSGGSTIDLTAISLADLTVDVSGGSEIDAAVSTTVGGNVSGGSTVDIKGSPSSTIASSGGSTVDVGP